MNLKEVFICSYCLLYKQIITNLLVIYNENLYINYITPPIHKEKLKNKQKFSNGVII